MNASIHVEYATPKAGLRTLVQYRGCVNDSEITIGDITHNPETLKFIGFQGSLLVDDGLYHGVCVFEPCTGDGAADARPANFHELLNPVVQQEGYDNGV